MPPLGAACKVLHGGMQILSGLSAFTWKPVLDFRKKILSILIFDTTAVIYAKPQFHTNITRKAYTL
jgi:hypothetical protein